MQQNEKQPERRYPAIFDQMGFHIERYDAATECCVIGFDVGAEFCHSVNVVQGGFVAAMLDAAMVHALFLGDKTISAVPSLEIKISYLAPTLAGPVTAHGRIMRKGRSIAFLEGELRNAADQVTAKASSTVRFSGNARPA